MLVDLEIGMGRTGIAPGDAAASLYALIAELPGLEPDGLQAYDGQIRDFDPIERRKSAQPGIVAVHAFRERLLDSGLPVPRLVMGGTPTFPIHALDETPGVECSPGTSVLHDAGYASKFPDLPFRPAAVLFTRVVSKPKLGRVCLDLGHKAVAADPVGPRLTLLGLADATLGGQSEEHLVVDSPAADALEPGSALLAIPIPHLPNLRLALLGVRARSGRGRRPLGGQGEGPGPGDLRPFEARLALIGRSARPLPRPAPVPRPSGCQ